MAFGKKEDDSNKRVPELCASAIENIGWKNSLESASGFEKKKINKAREQVAEILKRSYEKEQGLYARDAAIKRQTDMILVQYHTYDKDTTMFHREIQTALYRLNQYIPVFMQEIRDKRNPSLDWIIQQLRSLKMLAEKGTNLDKEIRAVTKHIYDLSQLLNATKSTFTKRIRTDIDKELRNDKEMIILCDSCIKHFQSWVAEPSMHRNRKEAETNNAQALAELKEILRDCFTFEQLEAVAEAFVKSIKDSIMKYITSVPKFDKHKKAIDDMRGELNSQLGLWQKNGTGNWDYQKVKTLLAELKKEWEEEVHYQWLSNTELFNGMLHDEFAHAKAKLTDPAW